MLRFLIVPLSFLSFSFLCTLSLGATPDSILNKNLITEKSPQRYPLAYHSYQIQKRDSNEQIKIINFLERFRSEEEIQEEEYQELSTILDGSLLPIFINSEKKEHFAPLLEKLEAYNISIDPYYIHPREVSQFLDQLKPGSQLKIKIQRMQKWFLQYYERPEEMDFVLGVSYALIRGTLLTSILISAGLNSTASILLGVYQFIEAHLKTSYFRTMDNLYSNRKVGQESPSFNKESEVKIRMAKDFVSAFFWKFLTGPLGDAKPLNTLTGIFEVLANVGVCSFFGNRMIADRHRILDKRGSRFFGFKTGLLFTLLGSLDFFGFHFGTLAKVGFFELNVSMVVLIGSFIGVHTWLIKKPEQFNNMAVKEEKFLQKIISGVKSLKEKMRNHCQLFFNKNKENKVEEKDSIDLSFYTPLQSFKLFA